MSNKSNENKLKYEKSPYLLQHRDNPIWWNGWNREALDRAKSENKPIFLSIGYSTCHWCHMMERETFEHKDVAEIINKYFVSIKVDREERPDLDSIYMRAIQLMGHRGGWPLSMFLTPDLEPFWGGTYVPKEDFKNLLKTIGSDWKDNYNKLKSTAEKFRDHLKMNVLEEVENHNIIGDSLLQSVYSEMKNSFEPYYGGFGGAPKFPPSMSIRLLLRLQKRASIESEKKVILDMIDKTLEGMFKGGLYDHIGFGFSRYSTDDKWLIPHFEKMLYDNANLSLCYLEAFSATQNPLYAEIVKETLDYVMNRMTDPKGGFYSAEDADSEGEEGKYYVWTQKELEDLLNGEEFKKVKEIYGVTEYGNFENETNHLNLLTCDNESIVFSDELKKMRKKLFNHREKRIHPHLDDKIITSWNGLMLTSFAKAYQIFGNTIYLKYAQNCALFIKDNLDKNQRLMRRYRDGEARFSAYLDDYSYLIQGLLDLYESDFDELWMDWAKQLQIRQDNLLWSKSSKAYFYAEQSDELLCPIVNFTDTAEPSPNGVSLLNLLRLYSFTYNASYMEKAKDLLSAFSTQMKEYPSAFIQASIALDYYLDTSTEIAVIGNDKDSETREVIKYLQQQFIPNKVLAFSAHPSDSSIELLRGKADSGEKIPAIYVCSNKTCSSPIYSLNELKKMIKA